MFGDAPGVVLAGKYELLERAGSGGMAVVWRGRTHGAAGFTRPVAIKRIVPHLSMDPAFVEMFVEEARIVSELQHPLITQIHDFGVDERGQYFLVMEWVEGIDLAQLADSFAADGCTVPWPLVGAIGIEISSALSAAHERRTRDGTAAPIYHRDITPQNVLLSVDGFVKLTDFGIARAMDRASMTQPNALKGKLSYLAPERVRGRPASVQSDLFGVGVCLWEALTNQRLFEADTDMQVLHLVSDAIVPDVRHLVPEVPRGFWDVLHTALARDPRHRFGTSHLMARRLADLVRSSDERTDFRRIAHAVRSAKERLGLRRDLARGPEPKTDIVDDFEEIF